MNCKEVEDLMPAYVCGETSESDSTGLVAHARHCIHCRVLLDDMQASFELWNRSSHVLLPETFTDAVMERILRLEDASVPRRRKRQSLSRVTLLHYGIAASLAATLLNLGVFTKLGIEANTLHDAISISVASVGHVVSFWRL